MQTKEHKSRFELLRHRCWFQKCPSLIGGKEGLQVIRFVIDLQQKYVSKILNGREKYIENEIAVLDFTFKCFFVSFHLMK